MSHAEVPISGRKPRPRIPRFDLCGCATMDKKAKLLAAIGLERQAGNWETTNELCLKYHRKYPPSAEKLEILALVESLLYTKVSKSGTLPNWDDSGASTNPPFSATETREVESLLTGLLDSGSPSEVQWQANIIKGWVDWLTGQFHSSLDRLKGLQESPKASSIGNYRALRIMKTVVMAWSLESLDRKSESSTLLDTTFSQSNGFLNVASSPTPRKLDTLESQWTEQYLFVWARLASLGSAKGSSQKLLEMYTSYTGLLAPDVLTTRRIRIYRNLFEAELPVFKSGSEDVYLTPLLMRPNQSQEVSTLRSHLPRYQSLLRQLVDLSKGVGTTDLDRARSQRLLESYDWLFTCQSSVSENETPEMAIQRHLKLIEILYEGTQHIFLSLKLFRYIGITFTSMFCVMDHRVPDVDRLESVKVVDLYLTRWQKAYTEALNHTDSASALQETIKETGESLYDVFSMIITAMRLFCFIGFHGNDSTHLGNYVDLAKILLENFQAELSKDMKSYGRVILYLNSACQERAFQGFIVDIRNLVSKEHARVNTTPNWLSNYQLALSLSKSQNYDLAVAVPALNQSIKSNPGNASAWHLLALMLFLRDDIEQAKRVCDLGIKECGRDLKATDVFTKKVDFILLNITRLDVEIYLYGSKNGMEAIQSLFALHKRLFGSSTSTLAPPNQSDSESGTASLLMQSYLWLKSATLYRELKQYSACKSAIDEAKKCLGPLVNIYREKMPLKLEVNKSTMERAQSSSSIDNRDVFTDIKWNTCPSDIRNLISDIIYEQCLVNFEEHETKAVKKEQPYDVTKLSKMEQLRVQFTGSSEHDVNETEHEHQHSIQSLIDELILANSISTSHISSQILIGNLFFKEKGRRDLAEIWLTKACEEKNETFITPLYENRKSYAWRKLAHVLDVTGRQEKAQKCILKALAVSNQHPVLWKLRTGLFDAI